ncbi:MAG: efflux RND transporter periplasmic adaptor subunit [Myxococcales bacterium]|nr:efflux RND transporter periplasmic adaptor subunit [Myxococcales bacterium]
MKLAILCIASMAIALGCNSGSHGHSHGADNGEHGAAEELPGESVTLWTEKAELFMEWGPLIVGRESRFLAHITDLTNANRFTAVVEGEVVVTISVGSKAVKAKVPEPARLGIFIPVLTPDTAGKCSMSLALQSAKVSETFAVANCTVYPDVATARSAIKDDETRGEIGFLKEQQWPIEFATAESRKQSIVPSKTVNATIRVVPGREARLTAATAGRLSLESPVPTVGSPVSKGQLLARIQPTISAPGSVGTLRADVAAARAEHTAAKAAHARLERLVATDSVPKRRLEDAASNIAVMQARLSAATTRLSSYSASASGSARPGSGAFRVSAPISGTLVEQSVTEGETTAAGAALFSIVDLERVWVEGRIFEPDVPAFEDSNSAWFTVDGRDNVFEVNEDTGKLITVGHVLDPASRTVPVIFEVQNPNRALRIGQYAKLSVATGTPVQGLVIPESAVLQDGNQSIVFVHSSGEGFLRRVVHLGTRSRGLVQVTQGVSEGERVVTKGAYDIKLASSAGGAPAHGHAH